jgi:ferredoxin-NADP reductase
MSVARYLTATNWPGKMHLILGFRSPRDFIFQKELAELQMRNANLGVTVTMSGPRDEPWSGRVGRIDAALLASTVPDLVAHRVHVCGPPPMMDAVKAALVSLGVPHAQIKTEASGVTAPVPVDATILDAADTAGVSIDNACRSGTCASCRVKLVSGQVTMAVEDALTDQDRADGYILACQAKVQGDIEVDA